MILLRGSSRTTVRGGLVGIALILAGLIVLLSGIAILALIALGAGALGAVAVAVRHMVGGGDRSQRMCAGTAPLELEADFDIVRGTTPGDQVESLPPQRPTLPGSSAAN